MRLAPARLPARGRRSPTRRLPVMAIALAFSMLAVACGSDDDDSPTAQDEANSGPIALRVSYVPATTVLPLQVAEAQGIFDRNNLDVTLTEAANISDIPATLGRQFDISLGTATDLIRAGAAGVDVVQVAGNTVSSKENPFVQIMVPADSGINGVADLRGRTIGSPTLSGVIHVGVLNWAKQNGVNPDDIRGVEAPSPALPDQLKAGRLDAVEALEPFASNLKRDGYVSIGDPFSPIADPLATNFWMAQGAWAEDNPEAINRFVNSLREAQASIEQDPAAARSILQGYTGMPAPVATAVPLPTYDFEIRADDLAKWEEVLTNVGQFNGNVDTNDLVVRGG